MKAGLCRNPRYSVRKMLQEEELQTSEQAALEALQKSHKDNFLWAWRMLSGDGKLEALDLTLLHVKATCPGKKDFK